MKGKRVRLDVMERTATSCGVRLVTYIGTVNEIDTEGNIHINGYVVARENIIRTTYLSWKY